jgi:hypothetical protein
MEMNRADTTGDIFTVQKRVEMVKNATFFWGYRYSPHIGLIHLPQKLGILS